MIHTRYRTGSKKRFQWIYSSKKWKLLRQVALNRAEGCCEECYSIGEIQVHHKKPVAQGGAIFDIDNLIVLCRSCHLEAHRKIEVEKMPVWKRKLYELIDKPVQPHLIRLKQPAQGGQLQ